MEKNESNGKGIASMVLGIVSLLFFWMPYITIFLSIVGIVLAVLQNKTYKNGIATTGLVTSIIGLVLSAILLFFLIIGMIAMASFA